MSPSEERQQAWMAQWRSASRELEAVWRQELRALSDAEARRASDALLSLFDPRDVPEHRLTWSGLVEQQRLLHSRRR
jgi:hypothetical protein